MKKLLTSFAIIAFLSFFTNALNATEKGDEVWRDLKSDLFVNHEKITTTEWLSMEAPDRAHDAAFVPIRIKTMNPTKVGFIKRLTLVVDNNPAPVAATFEFSPHIQPLQIETRIRVNQYTHVRAIAETNDNQLFMVTKYVKASGGCSAPAIKDLETAKKSLGKLKLRQFEPKVTWAKKKDYSLREVQLMVRHPNYSGLQMDQLTGYYIPAHYVSDIEVKLDGENLMKVQGAISLSENPNIRFLFQSKAPKPMLNVVVKDTEQKTFKQQWQLNTLPASGS